MEVIFCVKMVVLRSFMEESDIRMGLGVLLRFVR
jgi:hypothetical protein